MARKILTAFLAIFILSSCFLTVSAEEENAVFSAEGFEIEKYLFDSDRESFTSATGKATVTIALPEGIEHLYIEFDRIPEEWFLTDKESGKKAKCGQNGFLHEYVDVKACLGSASKELVLSFNEGTVISDIFAFPKGELPEFVQIWDRPCEEADLMLISSHSDDEQLFFAGVLPYYAIERKLQVQVVYIVQHFEVGSKLNHQRPHEQLDGLWAVGVKNYPVMSNFPDLYSESKDRDSAFNQCANVFEDHGISYNDFIGYITECLRRFKPLAVVSHDLDGEYGHGTHVFCASALTDAIKISGDETEFPESAKTYGVWTPEKVYLHLYEENQIIMDWDTPYESMGGKTPFEMTQEGFQCHKSQHWTWFNGWLNGKSGRPITKATEISSYSPCEYGLYFTSLGEDVIGGDFMENITTYEERKALEEKKKQEEQERLEAQKREEEAKKEAERLEAEKKQQEEEKQKQQSSAASFDREQEQGKEPLAIIWLVFGIFGIIILVLLVWCFIKTRR